MHGMTSLLVYSGILQWMTVIWLFLFSVFSTEEIQQTRCPLVAENFVQDKKSVELKIPLNLSPLLKSDISGCTVKYTFKDLKILNITIDNPLTQHHCSFEIELRTGIDDRPIKILSCREPQEWHIPWPWPVVFLSFIAKKENSGRFGWFVNVQLSPIFREINELKIKKPIKTINLPSVSSAECVDVISQPYKIIYHFKNRREYGKHGICVISDKDVKICIKTQVNTSQHYSTNNCPWKILFKRYNETLLTLRCDNIKYYWCLPWSIQGQLQVVWVDYPDASPLDQYSLFIAANRTVPFTDVKYQPLELVETAITTEKHIHSSTLKSNANHYDSGSSMLQDIISPLAAGLCVAIIACLVMCVRYKGQYGFRRAPSHRNINQFETSEDATMDRSLQDLTSTASFVDNIPPYYYYIYQMNKSLFPLPKEPPPPYPELDILPYPEEAPPSYEVALQMIDHRPEENAQT